jgi:flagellin-like hook-associated protein FlgL
MMTKRVVKQTTKDVLGVNNLRARIGAFVNNKRSNVSNVSNNTENATDE